MSFRPVKVLHTSGFSHSQPDTGYGMQPSPGSWLPLHTCNIHETMMDIEGSLLLYEAGLGTYALVLD
jgi:hypothetical protein